MSIDLPADVQTDLERYAAAEHLSLVEAAVRLIQSGLKSKRRKKATDVYVTDEQISQLKALNGSFGLLEDVPEEQIDAMSRTIKRMKREGFPKRG